MSKTFKDGRTKRINARFTKEEEKKYTSWLKKAYEYVINKNKIDESRTEI
jgi:hypothetical protein